MSNLKTLELLVQRINKATNSPLEPYTKTDTGIKPNAHCYHLGQQYGGVSLDRMCETGTGIRTIFHTCTKRELETQMRAFLLGLEG